MTKLKSFESFADYGNFIGSADDSMLPLVSSIGNDIACYVSKPGLDNNVSGDESDDGASGGGGDEAEYVYVDFTKVDRTNNQAAIYFLHSAASTLKVYYHGSFIWTPPGAAFDEDWEISESMIKGCKIDKSNQLSIFTESGWQLKPFPEVFEDWKTNNTGYENFNLETMSKEEYYSTNPIPPIPFVIKIDANDEYSLMAEDGMTFEEWANSDYNTIGLTISDGKVLVGDKPILRRSVEYLGYGFIGPDDYPANILSPYYLALE